MEQTGSSRHDSEFDSRTALTLGEVASTLREQWKLLLILPLLVCALAFGTTYLMTPTFTARTTFLPPQQSQGLAASALAQLGPLAGLAGVGGSTKGSPDQFVALMQSITISNKIIDRFDLRGVYGTKLYVDTRSELSNQVKFMVGKKDGLISISVDDHDPTRAASIANQYVEELRWVLGRLTTLEAKQRRTFFESELSRSKEKLTQAQRELQTSGFNASTLKAEPKATAEGYAKLKADVTAAEIRLRYLRSVMADGANEVRQQQALYDSLRAQLVRAEQPAEGVGGSNDYITKYREFKYQETLFELYARQFELARVDEIRDAALIQVVDPAMAPERKSKPRRLLIAAASLLASAIMLTAALLLRRARNKGLQNGQRTPVAI